jgi:two-component system, response regulator YesN
MIKVLIVDDEEWIRLGLREQVDWSMLGLEITGEAQNGAVALELIEKEQPQIVITDIRMPKVDGLTLMENIHNSYPNILIIVISGYSEFEYARKAISFSAFDYILKPIEEAELERILVKAVQKLKENASRESAVISLKAELNSSSRLLRDRLLTNLVTGNESDCIEASRYVKETCGGFRWPRMVVMAFKPANFEKITEVIYEKDAQLAGFALMNVIGELLGGNEASVLFRNDSRRNELILIRGFNTDEYRSIVEETYELCEDIITTVRKYIGFELYIGIGGEFTNLKDAPRSYAQAVEAAGNAGLLPDARIIHIDEVSSRNEYFIYPDDKEKALLYYIESGYKIQAADLIDGLFRKMEESRTAIPQSIRSTVLELALGIGKMLKNYNCFLEELLQERNIPDRIMNGLFTSTELKQWFLAAAMKALDEIAAHKKTGTKKMVDVIAEYMDGHYGAEVNLNTVSEHFFINPAYLSRIFKSTMGRNFNDYLSKRRMEAAVELLKQENLRMADISEMVGYENVNYFLKKFKEYFSCTPTEYRKKDR